MSRLGRATKRRELSSGAGQIGRHCRQGRVAMPRAVGRPPCVEVAEGFVELIGFMLGCRAKGFRSDWVEAFAGPMIELPGGPGMVIDVAQVFLQFFDGGIMHFADGWVDSAGQQLDAVTQALGRNTKLVQRGCVLVVVWGGFNEFVGRFGQPPRGPCTKGTAVPFSSLGFAAARWPAFFRLQSSAGFRGEGDRQPARYRAALFGDARPLLRRRLRHRRTGVVVRWSSVSRGRRGRVPHRQRGECRFSCFFNRPAGFFGSQS